MPLNIGPQIDVVIMPDNLAEILPIVVYRQKLSNLQDQIKQLQSEANALIDEMINECPHPIGKIVEAEPEEDDCHRLYDTEFRVCKVCGYAENGAYGYCKLGRGVFADYGDGEGVPVVNRNEAEKMTTKMHSREEMLDMIRRGE